MNDDSAAPLWLSQTEELLSRNAKEVGTFVGVGVDPSGRPYTVVMCAGAETLLREDLLRGQFEKSLATVLEHAGGAD